MSIELADVHSVGLAPAFPFVALRQEIRPQTANAHSLSRYGAFKKNKEKREQRTQTTEMKTLTKISIGLIGLILGGTAVLLHWLVILIR